MIHFFSRLGRRKLQQKGSFSDDTKSGGEERKGREWLETPVKSNVKEMTHPVTPNNPLRDILNIKHGIEPPITPLLHSTSLYDSFAFQTPAPKGFGLFHPSPLDPLYGIINHEDSFVTAIASPKQEENKQVISHIFFVNSSLCKGVGK